MADKTLRSFNALLKRVVSVPKGQVDAKIAQKKAANVAQREAKPTDNPPKK